MSKDFRPFNQPTEYDEERGTPLRPIEAAIESLQLPLLRGRKVIAILNALEMQVEDGGDSPEVNRLLIDALRAAVRYQVGEKEARAALRTIDDFDQGERKRWERSSSAIADRRIAATGQETLAQCAMLVRQGQEIQALPSPGRRGIESKACLTDRGVPTSGRCKTIFPTPR